MRPAPLTARPSRSRTTTTAAMVLALSVLLAACGGGADTASRDAGATDAATGTGTAATDAAIDPTTGDLDPVACEGARAVLELVGNASNPDNDDDQIRDAVELMGQTVGELEAAGVDPVVLEAADAIHEQFALIVGDATAEPDYAVVEDAGAELRRLVETCDASGS